MIIWIDLMLDNFVIDFIVQLAVVQKHWFEFSHFLDDEAILLNEILHFYSSSQKSFIQGHYALG